MFLVINTFSHIIDSMKVFVLVAQQSSQGSGEQADMLLQVESLKELVSKFEFRKE